MLTGKYTYIFRRETLGEKNIKGKQLGQRKKDNLIETYQSVLSFPYVLFCLCFFSGKVF